MIELVLLCWKAYRLEVAITVAILIFSFTILLPLFDSEPYDFWNLLLSGFYTLAFYLGMTPLYLLAFYYYKKQQNKWSPEYEPKNPQVFTLDNFLCVFTIYSIFGYILSLIVINTIY